MPYRLEALRRLRATAAGDDEFAALGARPLRGGMQNALYRCGDNLTIKFFLRTDRQRVAREWAALTLLAPHRLGVAPVPLWLDATPVEPAIGMTWLAGDPLTAGDLGAVADTIARLQAVPLTGLLATVPRVDSAEHYLVRLTRSWPDLLDRAPTDPRTAEMRRLLARWTRTRDADLVPATGEPVLSRGDANLLNWLVTPAGAACVDFEYAGYSDRVFDAADLVEHISARDIPDTVWADLLPSLGVAGTNRRRFRACQRTCALRWLAILWKQRDRRRPEFDRQHERVRTLFSDSHPFA